MEIGDWIILILVVVGLLMARAYLMTHNPTIYTNVDSTTNSLMDKAGQALLNLVKGVFNKVPINSTGGGG